jgi:hypothetical protein
MNKNAVTGGGLADSSIRDGKACRFTTRKLGTGPIPKTRPAELAIWEMLND